ncbi:MAG: hypothetical protein KDB07_01580, partial [Planctomycetes bacterium]|nr:hypothetical protein [Planctomycetota bacterium]
QPAPDAQAIHFVEGSHKPQDASEFVWVSEPEFGEAATKLRMVMKLPKVESRLSMAFNFFELNNQMGSMQRVVTYPEAASTGKIEAHTFATLPLPLLPEAQAQPVIAAAASYREARSTLVKELDTLEEARKALKFVVDAEARTKKTLDVNARERDAYAAFAEKYPTNVVAAYKLIELLPQVQVTPELVSGFYKRFPCLLLHTNALANRMLDDGRYTDFTKVFEGIIKGLFAKDELYHNEAYALLGWSLTRWFEDAAWVDQTATLWKAFEERIEGAAPEEAANLSRVRVFYELARKEANPEALKAALLKAESFEMTGGALSTVASFVADPRRRNLFPAERTFERLAAAGAGEGMEKISYLWIRTVIVSYVLQSTDFGLGEMVLQCMSQLDANSYFPSVSEGEQRQVRTTLALARAYFGESDKVQAALDEIESFTTSENGAKEREVIAERLLSALQNYSASQGDDYRVDRYQPFKTFIDKYGSVFTKFELRQVMLPVFQGREDYRAMGEVGDDLIAQLKDIEADATKGELTPEQTQQIQASLSQMRQRARFAQAHGVLFGAAINKEELAKFLNSAGSLESRPALLSALLAKKRIQNRQRSANDPGEPVFVPSGGLRIYLEDLARRAQGEEVIAAVSEVLLAAEAKPELYGWLTEIAALAASNNLDDLAWQTLARADALSQEIPKTILYGLASLRRGTFLPIQLL